MAFKLAYVGIEYSGLAQQSTVPNTIEEYLFNALKKTLLVQDIESSFSVHLVIIPSPEERIKACLL